MGGQGVLLGICKSGRGRRVVVGGGVMSRDTEVFA